MEQTLYLRGVNFKVHWAARATCERPFHAEWHGRGPGPLARARRSTGSPPTTAAAPISTTATSSTPRSARSGAIASRAIVGGLPAREADASLQRLKALVERDGR